MATTRYVLTPRSAELFGAAPTLSVINDRPFLAFDAATDQNAHWTVAAPQGLTGTMTAVICYMMATATTGSVRFQVAVEAVSDGDATDLDTTTSFDTDNSAGATVPGTAGYIDQLSVTLTNQDSVAAADYLRIRVRRDADGTSGTDDATGDCRVLYVELRDAA